jgi:hypothetical protein
MMRWVACIIRSVKTVPPVETGSRKITFVSDEDKRVERGLIDLATRVVGKAVGVSAGNRILIRMPRLPGRLQFDRRSEFVVSSRRLGQQMDDRVDPLSRRGHTCVLNGASEAHVEFPAERIEFTERTILVGQYLDARFAQPEQPGLGIVRTRGKDRRSRNPDDARSLT